MQAEQIADQKMKNKKWRAVKAIFFLLVLATCMGVLYGIRVTAFGAKGGEVEKIMILWGAVVFIVGLFLVIPYLIGRPLLSGDWRVVLLSGTVGILPLMHLYPRLSSSALEYLSKPVENPVLNNPGRLKLIGGIDGLVFGIIIGVMTVFVDPKLKLSNHQGILRYVILTVLITSTMILYMVINEMGELFDLLANFVPWIVLPGLKYGLANWHKIQKRKG